MTDVFGLDPLAVAIGMNVAAWLGWTYTLWKYGQTLREMKRAQFWWEWWGETAIRHGIQIGRDDIEAARVLQPDDGPSIRDQIRHMAPDGQAYIATLDIEPEALEPPGDDD